MPTVTPCSYGDAPPILTDKPRPFPVHTAVCPDSPGNSLGPCAQRRRFTNEMTTMLVMDVISLFLSAFTASAAWSCTLRRAGCRHDRASIERTPTHEHEQELWQFHLRDSANWLLYCLLMCLLSIALHDNFNSFYRFTNIAPQAHRRNLPSVCHVRGGTTAGYR